MSDFLFVSEEVIKQYRARTRHLIATAVNRASIKARAGEIVMIYGEAGCGKSTLLRVCAGIAPVDYGSIKIRGTDICKLDFEQATFFRGAYAGIIFTSPILLPKLTVEENIVLPAFLSGRQKHNYEIHYQKIMNMLNLEEIEKSPVYKLTPGQCQRVAAARALINRPQVLFADEPESGLDGEEREEFLDLFYKTARALSQTVIYAAKSPLDKIKYDRIYKMDKGRLIPMLLDQPII
ncbi:MAG: ATP-binding cassette domain-containing protein [Clostridiales bacterium]|nr:ATP-binding cassette domain-containing protein [Clostridiales bacterium]